MVVDGTQEPSVHFSTIVPDVFSIVSSTRSCRQPARTIYAETPMLSFEMAERLSASEIERVRRRTEPVASHFYSENDWQPGTGELSFPKSCASVLRGCAYCFKTRASETTIKVLAFRRCVPIIGFYVLGPRICAFVSSPWGTGSSFCISSSKG